MAQNANPVQSIDRVFDIIEILSKYPRGLLLSDLTPLVELPKSTVHRLLLSLSERGYVAKEMVSGRYQLTMRMFEIGSRAIGVLDIITIARPYLEHLADSSSEIVHLVERDGKDVVYLSKLDASSSSIRTASAVGLRAAMYCTGVGKAILANLPPEEVQAIWASTPIEQFTRTTITSYEALQEELRRIEISGYAIDNEEHELGVRCVAAPIFDFSDRPRYAVSISAPSTRMGEQEIEHYAPMLVSASQEISRFLGRNLAVRG